MRDIRIKTCRFKGLLGVKSEDDHEQVCMDSETDRSRRRNTRWAVSGNLEAGLKEGISWLFGFMIVSYAPFLPSRFLSFSLCARDTSRA